MEGQKALIAVKCAARGAVLRPLGSSPMSVTMTEFRGVGNGRHVAWSKALEADPQP